ncbi:hypothetical protein BGX38DRAFT_280545 [Terfezia claveryi]|nr:hypothetical protein BGX38DRAFT_280545 [Terfezia claveryi]
MASTSNTSTSTSARKDNPPSSYRTTTPSTSSGNPITNVGTRTSNVCRDILDALNSSTSNKRVASQGRGNAKRGRLREGGPALPSIQVTSMRTSVQPAVSLLSTSDQRLPQLRSSDDATIKTKVPGRETIHIGDDSGDDGSTHPGEFPSIHPRFLSTSVMAQRVIELMENPTFSFYQLQLIHGTERRGIIVTFVPYYQAAFDASGVVPYQLVSSFLSQLRSHFCRPDSDQVLLSVANELGVTYGIGTEEVVRAILRRIQAQVLASGEHYTEVSWWSDKFYVEFRPLPKAEVDVHLAQITVYTGLWTQSMRSILNAPITTTLVLPLIGLSVSSLIEELEEYLQGEEAFASEVNRLKKVLIQQTQYAVDGEPNLSTMVRWSGVTVPGSGGLGKEMFSLLREGVWKVVLQAVVSVVWQPAVGGTGGVGGAGRGV